MITKVPLGEAGLDYLQRELAGGDYVAEALLGLALSQGSVYALLPEGMDATLLSLQHGGIGRLLNEDGETDYSREEAAVQLAADFLSASAEHLLVMELGTLEREGQAFWPEAVGAVLCQSSLHRVYRTSERREQLEVDSAYGFVGGGDRLAVAQLFQYARPFPEIGILTSAAGMNQILRPGTFFERAVLQSLAQAAEHIIVSAYDGEAYILWSRRDC